MPALTSYVTVHLLQPLYTTLLSFGHHQAHKLLGQETKFQNYLIGNAGKMVVDVLVVMRPVVNVQCKTSINYRFLMRK